MDADYDDDYEAWLDGAWNDGQPLPAQPLPTWEDRAAETIVSTIGVLLYLALLVGAGIIFLAALVWAVRYLF